MEARHRHVIEIVIRFNDMAPDQRTQFFERYS